MIQGGSHFYKLTPTGRALWTRRASLPLPPMYLRILGLVDFSGHESVIRSQLARFPPYQVDAWLSEFAAIDLIESAHAGSLPPLRIAAPKSPPAIDEGDDQRFSRDADYADISLSRLGVYVAHERSRFRTPSDKRPQDTLAMVLEDDPDQIALAVLRLTAAGYRVAVADSVKAFQQTLAARTPDALFLDVMLPDGNGFDVLASLRMHPSYALLPIIMLTAKVEPADIAHGLALGADAYVTKPYGSNTLDYVLRYVRNQPLRDAHPPHLPA